jgi:hypothetical protein
MIDRYDGGLGLLGVARLSWLRYSFHRIIQESDFVGHCSLM